MWKNEHCIQSVSNLRPSTQRLPKLRENNKLIQLGEEINGITEELLKENETDIADINRFIYAAATVVTETITKPGKTVKNIRNKDSWKTRIQRQNKQLEKKLSILVESGAGSDNIKLNIKKRNIFRKYKVTNVRDTVQLIQKLEQKVQAKAQRIRRYDKRKNQYIQNKRVQRRRKTILQIFGSENYRYQRPPTNGS
jgi:hypothetical protein